jgi:hypothetical protein
MSTKKEAEKILARTTDDDKQVEVRIASSLSDQRYSVNRVLNETRDNFKRSIEEARKEIPRNSQTINDYQEQNLQVAQEITDNYLDSQREIINSFQSVWAPHIENYFNVCNNWASPRRTAELYARAVSNFADNVMTATKIGNNAMIANMVAFRIYLQLRKEDTKEYSRIGTNTARVYAQTSRDIANE